MDVDEKYIGLIFRRWIDVMSVELKCLVAWPDKEALDNRSTIAYTPTAWARATRRIIDCFEIFIQCPTYFLARAQTYSQYQRHNTVAPTGSICFISEAWGGRVSDKVEFGDDIMADRGFNIGDDLAVCGAQLLIPAFTKGKEQLSAREVEITRRLAQVCIHVERVICHLHKKYKILQQTLPINMIKLS
uniref:DDE Tnp4 domain-containing protein n=1 Tax=Amphimedon queenslandica TaxID=400682 RepID=A0A1X7UW99_AMPQE